MSGEGARPADLPELPPGPPLLVVLSGASGTGKDAIRDLRLAWGLPFHSLVTATTRPRRTGEVAGRDYRFLSNAEFDRLEAADGLIEHATVYGRRYGVPRDEVLAPLAAGRDVIARVDVQGAATLRRLIPDALLIFIAAPSVEEARRRLEARDTDSEADRRLRLETAAAEMEAAREFDYVVVNETGRLEDAARRVVEIVVAEKRRRARTA